MQLMVRIRANEIFSKMTIFTFGHISIQVAVIKLCPGTVHFLAAVTESTLAATRFVSMRVRVIAFVMTKIFRANTAAMAGNAIVISVRFTKTVSIQETAFCRDWALDMTLTAAYMTFTAFRVVILHQCGVIFNAVTKPVFNALEVSFLSFVQ